ncbi:MAG TPA: ABC transporter substrate-binding protein [Bryobacteraceae bacterium]|jgi:NitT/TauT family transport system substrate-binding protein|nr:ABC transporter substrate-binding protein [Bryobacteraceae bacterium]
MPNRRHFLQTGFFLAAAGLAGAAALSGARRSMATEAPPETTALRLPQYPATCLAPLYILDDLLREEGFTDVRYVPNPGTTSEIFARGEVDFDQDFSPVAIVPIDAGAPIVMLAGVHSGCFELFARESIRSVGDLKGRKVGIPWAGEAQQVIVSIIVANIGLDPARDIDWVVHGPRDPKELLDRGEIDAFLTVPPWAQELHARDFGHTILNSTVDRPWSQYLCCMLIGHADFVRRNPIATKRVVRAMIRATDICAAKPEWVAQRLVDRGITPRYASARRGLYDVPYRNWRDYDPEDAVRFWALRLREIGMIKSSPDKIIATGTDWRFIKEVRKELGI